MKNFQIIIILIFLASNFGYAQVNSNCISIQVDIIKNNQVISPPDSFTPTSTDADGDGIPNNQDPDTDGDGIPNTQDPDADGDGILNAIDGNQDFDGDNIVNYLDTDSDDDGLSDKFEGVEDYDGDGQLNYLDLDSDGDNVGDSEDDCYKIVGSVLLKGCPAPPQEKTVFWVHGYQGNENSWDLAGEDVQNNYQMQTRKADYNANGESLSAAADNISEDIEGWTYNQINKEKNFVIAHSLGGLVSRTMGVLQDDDGPLFNGFITFGTPHLGAGPADVLVNNPAVVQNAMTATCNALSAGPLEEELAFPNGGNTGLLPSFGELVSIFGLVDDLSEFACQTLGDIIVPAIIPLAETGVEPEVTTAAASSIPGMATEHNAVFYGIEEDDNETMAPKFLGSVLNGPNTFPLYQAGEADALGVQIFQEWEDFYVSKFNSYNELSWSDFLNNPFQIFQIIKRRKVARAYQKGIHWFPTFNPTWKEMIGAADVVLEELDGCNCYFEGLYGDEFIFVGYDPECDDNCDFLLPVYNYTTISRPSDGFITAESAMDAPGATYPPEFMPGSNHLQMRNDGNTEEAMDKIFENGLGGDFFRTDAR